MCVGGGGGGGGDSLFERNLPLPGSGWSVSQYSI